MTAKTVIAINLIISESIIQIYTFLKECFSKKIWHPNLNESTTYLRGLEVAKLKEEDIPMVLLLLAL